MSVSLAPKPVEAKAIEKPAKYELYHLSPTIGTEVWGVDMANTSDDELAYLRQVLLDRKVIFFRDQDITVEQHLAFGRRWGELETIPFLPFVEGYPEVLHIHRDHKSGSRENVWHSDVSWRERPSFGSILRGIQIPEVGGDTLFADMCLAYDMMPQYLKQAAEGLQAVHSNAGLTGYAQRGEAKMTEVQKGIMDNPPQVHPVIRTHPETGRKLIYVNRAFTRALAGYHPAEGQDLLKALMERAHLPEVQCRFRWRKNSVAFWDNRACQHYASYDYKPHIREMHRVTIKGDKPF
jgi:taurine dioxygenase